MQKAINHARSKLLAALAIRDWVKGLWSRLMARGGLGCQCHDLVRLWGVVNLIIGHCRLWIVELEERRAYGPGSGVRVPGSGLGRETRKP